MSTFKFAAQFSGFGQAGISSATSYATFLDRVQACDEAGYEALFLPDHVFQNENGGGRQAPMFEAYTLFGALAERTSQIYLAALVTAVTFRYPAVLAKTITTLDVISGGRAMLGFGAGWDDNEHRGYGITFPSTATRMDQLAEAAQICRAMFDEEAATFTGEEFQIVEATNVPRPIQAHIPILIGGAGEKRTLRIAAQYADEVHIFGDFPTFAATGSDDPVLLRHKYDVLEQHCADVGRDPSEITKTAAAKIENGDLDALKKSVELAHGAGAEGVIIFMGEHTPDVIHASAEELKKAFG